MFKDSADRSSQITDYLQTPPRPLFDKRTNLALMWSAKAGSTFAVKWFFYQTGLLFAAEYYSLWIHEFRETVFYRSKRYINNIKHFANHSDRYHIVKIVRNPFDRTVSTYLHVLEWLHRKESLVRPIRYYLKRKNLFKNTDALSFHDFVGFLESISVLNCDIHWRQQFHPLEKNGGVAPEYIVKLENSYEWIKKIEQELKLKESRLDDFRSSRHYTKRTENHEFCGKKTFRYRKEKNYPISKSFYDEDLRQRVMTIYKDDFAAYGYDTDY